MPYRTLSHSYAFVNPFPMFGGFSMDTISDFMCSDAGQWLTLAVLFIALVLNLFSFVLKLCELFHRSTSRDEVDMSPHQGWSNDSEYDQKGLAS